MEDVVDTASFSDRQKFFARVSDTDFWDDEDRVQVLIDLYEKFDCLWNVKDVEYKNVLKKKRAKEDIGKHFSFYFVFVFPFQKLSFIICDVMQCIIFPK